MKIPETCTEGGSVLVVQCSRGSQIITYQALQGRVKVKEALGLRPVS